MSPILSQIQLVPRGLTPRTALRWGLQWMVVLALVASLFLSPVQSVKAQTIPTFSIVSVVPNSTVTIQTYNFPPNQIFTVRMGPYGTLGIGGIVVAQTNSGAGGSFQETYTIPSSLYGSQQIAIRMDSDLGYYAYNWFWNVVSPTPGPTTIPGTGYYGIPTFSIQAVVKDQTVTVLTNNFPPNQTFTVQMGLYGSLGYGYVVATTNSGAGGSFQATYNIPAALYGQAQIAIRMDSNYGYYAYNWFWNNSTNVTPGTPPPTTIPGTGYTGYPTFSILSVVRDQTVTIQTYNVPPNQDFTVRMGPYGSLGIGGIVVATTNSGAGGSYQATYNIPSALYGQAQIAIRMDSPMGYYAYNWFWNNSTGAVTPAPTVTPGGPTNTPVPTAIPGTGYVGIPTFSISAVVQNQTVTVLTNNFPPNQTFTVQMGPYGSLGYGYVVASTNSGSGGAFQATYTIPAALQGQQRIAIRMDSPAGYYAYNWFWNSTYP